MQPGLYHIVPATGAVLLVISLLIAICRRNAADNQWLVPTSLAVLFAGWSAIALREGGPLGFWAEHVRNAWSNQIWLDLLCAAGTAFVLLLPRARAVRMFVWPWLALVLATGSLGLLAMLARCLWLEGRSAGHGFVEGKG